MGTIKEIKKMNKNYMDAIDILMSSEFNAEKVCIYIAKFYPNVLGETMIPKWEQEVKEVFQKNGKLYAVKFLRETKEGLGLKDAVRILENVMNSTEEFEYARAIDILTADDFNPEKICAEIAKKYPELFCKAATGKDSLDQRIIDMVETTEDDLGKRKAIKMVRSEKGLSLKESKLFVEDVLNRETKRFLEVVINKKGSK